MLQGLYWFTAIFGVGVTVIDLLGLIGSGGQADDGSAAEAADDGSGEEGGGEDGGGAPVLSFLRYVRTAIYFCLGFGPFGLASTAFGSGPAGSLIWALAGGSAVAVLARLFFRLQRTELDSSIKEEELLFEQATVIAPIADGGMGKVRIRLGQSVAERYALAENPEERFSVDARVQVAQVTDRCVYVRGLEASQELS
jgi:membrane protein implicated in regulation of membrane protease activity